MPLSARLWQGGILDAQQLPKRKRGKQRHYAMGHLFNIGTEQPEHIAALTVGDHLQDLLHVQVIRTSVGVDTEWDASSPDPPAEYLLVASGVSPTTGVETLTFWAVATIFSSPEEHEQDHGASSSFSIHVAFLQEYSLGASSSSSLGCVSIFCNDRISQHWRKRRRVERKVETNDDDSRRRSALESTTASTTTATLSTPAPLKSLRFKKILLQQAKEDKNENCEERLLLAVSDYNGGVSVLDCTAALQKASGSSLETETETATLVCMVSSRNDMRQQLKGAMVQDLAWTSGVGSSSELVVVTTRGTLVVVPTMTTLNSSTTTTSTSLTLPRGVQSTRLVETAASVALLWLSSRNRSSSKLLMTAALQLANPRSILERLVQSEQYAEALEAAAGFYDHQDLIQSIVATCHQRLWETKGLVQHVRAVSDDAYVIQQVLSSISNTNNDKHLTAASCREACRLALARCSTLRVATALQLGGDGTTVESIQRQLTHRLV